ncbi:all-trans-retinol 13,14-reductase [Chryseobacterium sp. H1D6B]|uniref:phytoene desaturase family protein n=1 Tax=Chryseobacterium sp. H1D6B TaxID=2940588 RepID=UPI0015CA67D7|nr:NAD(P)/FAD-dependent oxidoreductase [Chryseobacterium sp. H1D6B]MDH6251324.1 all-trans-retinol 13,14-reductase [Chryseobacterium sp. H1D6B]
MKKKYDILVIGSGLGGLVSALVLAKEGLKVCVLEKNNQYGGNLQTFSRNKMIFDTGVHYLGGLSEGQNLNQYFTYLGIMEDLKLKKLDEDGYDRITFDDDETAYPHSQGYENFIEQLSKIFPDERENLLKYCDEIQNVCNQFPRYSLIRKEKYNDEILYTNAKEFIESITPNKRLQAVLSGSNFLYAGVADKTPLYVHALTVNSYIQSSYKCVNGGSQISKLLIKKLRDHGAEVYKHSQVTEMIFDEDNTLISVKTKQGREFHADQFISNIEIRTTLDLIGHQRLKKSFINRVYDLEPVTSCFSIYLTLKPNTFKYFNHNFYHYTSEDVVWEVSNPSRELWPEWYMFSSTASKHHPEFAESLTAISYMSYDEVKEWENTFNTIAENHERGNNYENFKQEKAEKLISKIEEKFPELRNAIKEIYTSTPLSYRDYIGGYKGNMYGYVKDCKNPLKTIISSKTKISNLFLTGQSINMHGILGVTIGAFVTCSEILGKDVIDQRLSKVLTPR